MKTMARFCTNPGRRWFDGARILGPNLIVAVACSCGEPVDSVRDSTRRDVTNQAHAEAPPVTDRIIELIDPESGTWFGYTIVECADIDGDGEAECAIASKTTAGIGHSRVELVSLASGRVVESFVLSGGTPCQIAYVPGKRDSIGGSGLVVAASGTILGSSSAPLQSVLAYYDLQERRLGWEQVMPHGAAGWGMGLCLVSPIESVVRPRRELVIGAPWFNCEDGSSGAVAAVDLQHGALNRIDSVECGGLAGMTITRIPDTEGDEASELAIGCPEWRVRRDGRRGSKQVGRVVFISSRDYSVTGDLPGVPENGEFGQALAALSDWNSDGRNDLAIGSPLASRGISFQGAVHVVSGLDRSELFRLDGDCPNCMFGSSLLKVGDLDGDDISDFVVGAPGCGRACAFGGCISIIGSARRQVVMRLTGTDEGLMLGESSSSMAWVSWRGIKALAVGDCGVPSIAMGRAGRVFVIPESCLKSDIRSGVGERKLVSEATVSLMRP